MRYLLSINAAQNGHVCLPRDKLAASTASLLGVSVQQTDEAISKLLALDLLKYSRFDDIQYIYPADAYTAEKYIADKLVELDRTCAGLSTDDIARFILREEQEGGIVYAA